MRPDSRQDMQCKNGVTIHLSITAVELHSVVMGLFACCDATL